MHLFGQPKINQLLRQVGVFAALGDGQHVHHAKLPFDGHDPLERLARLLQIEPGKTPHRRDPGFVLRKKRRHLRSLCIKSDSVVLDLGKLAQPEAHVGGHTSPSAIDHEERGQALVAGDVGQQQVALQLRAPQVLPAGDAVAGFVGAHHQTHRINRVGHGFTVAQRVAAKVVHIGQVLQLRAVNLGQQAFVGGFKRCEVRHLDEVNTGVVASRFELGQAFGHIACFY